MSGEVYWSDGMYRLLGYDPNEVIDFAKVNSDIHHPDDLERVKQWLQDSIVSGVDTLTANEYRLIRKDGSIIYVQTNGWIVRQSGQALKLYGTCLDITERKLAEAQLRLQSEIAANSVEGIALIRASDGRIHYANRRFEAMFGYEVGGLTERPVAEVNAATDKTPEEVAAQIIQSLRDNHAWHGEVLNKRKDGSVFWTFADVSTFSHPELGDLWITYQKDITEQKRAEQALRDSELKYRSLYAAMIEGMALHEIVYADEQAIDYVILDVNPAFEKILTLQRDDVVGRRASEVYGVNQAPYLDRFADIVETGQPTKFETRFEPMQKCFLISAFSPAPRQFATIFEDITERKKIEEELRMAATVYQALDDAIMVTDADNHIMAINSAFTKVTGYSES